MAAEAISVVVGSYPATSQAENTTGSCVGFGGSETPAADRKANEFLEDFRLASTYAILFHRFGRRIRYSCGGYTIIQQILMDVTGEPFPELMQELVLQPLHMVHSTFQQPIPEKRRLPIAMPYDSNGSAIEGGPHTYP